MINRELANCYITILGHVLLKFITQVFWHRYHLILSISVTVICIDSYCLDKNLGSKDIDEFGE